MDITLAVPAGGDIVKARARYIELNKMPVSRLRPMAYRLGDLTADRSNKRELVESILEYEGVRVVC